MILTERFDEALAYAHACHRQQRRKGTKTPYVAHLLAVCSIALEHGADEDVAIAALLHDAAEDGGGEPKLAEIAARFGERVAGIVRGCSDSLAEDPSQKAPWEERKLAYLQRLMREPDAGVLLVSAADKLHNARATLADVRRHGDGVWARFNAGPERQLWYYRSLLAVFRRHGRHEALIDELAGVVDELHAAAHRLQPVETEAKWRLEGAVHAERLAATMEERAGPPVRRVEDNRLFDDGDALRGRDQVLRVRTFDDGVAVLTWKGTASYDGTLRSRQELELRVEDGARMIDVLGRLGFEETVRYGKERSTWHAGGVEVALDRLEFGHFVEIEGAPERIAELVESLGLVMGAAERRGYPALMREYLRQG